MHRLHDSPSPQLPPKARMLSEAAHAGLPVPEGVVHPVAWTDALAQAVTALLERGPVIVRAALHGEDGPRRAAAGLGTSVPGCTDVEAVRSALTHIDAQRRDEWLVRYRGTEEAAEDRVIVQHQIERDVLVVAAALPDGSDYIEAHAGTLDALAQGDTPIVSGLLERWNDPRADAVSSLLAALRATMPMPEYGFDVELVVDDAGAAHLVQVRPLTRDLTAEGRAFVEAVHAAGQGDRLGGVQVLDAEHNPAPLSPAHASLIEYLAQQRPASGGLSPLAGWLYVRTKVRDLSGTPNRAPMQPQDALLRLRDVELPAARERLEHVVARGLDVDAALSAFLEMIDVYLGVLLPVRATASKTLVSSARAPLSLRDRAAHADVLPCAWDVAAPTLGEVARFSTERGAELPTDPVEAAVLLTEWDDHLFALGLAPVRAVYRSAGEHLGLGEAVFGLSLEQLRRALSEPDFDAAEQARTNLRTTASWAALRPPAVLDEGRPVPLLPHRLLHGAAVGGDFEGPIAQRRDLEQLLRDPPEPGCIVVLPALTAQAALALSTLSVRAVCCEHGGALSHAALMMRELELRGLVGCAGCTRVPDGTPARIDARTGRLQIASSVTLGS